MTEELLQKEIDKHNDLLKKVNELREQMNEVEQARLIQLGRCQYIKEQLDLQTEKPEVE